MFTSSVRNIVISLAAFCVSIAAFAAPSAPMHLNKEILMRGSTPFTVRAITVPDAAKPGITKEEVERTLNLAAEPGGDAICVDVYGIAPDGKSVSPDAVQAVRQIFAVSENRNMIGIVRLFGPQAPTDKKARLAWAKTAANAFGEDVQYIYLIEGKDASKLAKTFKKNAKDLVVAAPKNGDITLTEKPGGKSKKCTLLIGSIPPAVVDGAHFILPEGDASYKSLEVAMTDPSEKEPWTPDNSVLSPEERADGFIALFDGKTKNGWTVLGEKKDAWIVKDGALERVSAGSNGLRTHDRYANFILRWEWKLPEGGNNGVHLRAPRGARASRIGFEYQMLGDYGTEPNKNSTGSIYDVQAPTVNAVKPNGEWNTSEAIFDGPHITYTLNGVKVNEANMDENELLRPRLRKGFIVLTEHNAPVMYRNVRIKPLP